MEAGGSCLPLHGRHRRRLCGAARVRAPDAERRPRPGDASRRRCDGDRVADPPDLRPRAARAVPEHAAGVQGHISDERRQLGSRRLRRHRRGRRRPRGDRHPAAAEAARGARLVRDRAAARDVHGRAAREHGDPRVERGARRAAVRLRLERLRKRRRGRSDLHDPRVGGTSPPRRSRRLRARARRRARDGEAARLRRRGLPAGRGRQVREGLEGPRRRGSRAARARRPPQPHRSRRRRHARARGRAGAPLVDLQSGLPVRARPEVHRRAAEGAQGASAKLEPRADRGLSRPRAGRRRRRAARAA